MGSATGEASVLKSPSIRDQHAIRAILLLYAPPIAVSLRLLIAELLIVSLTGCGYSLPPMHPASQERIRIIAVSTERYVLHANTDSMKQYEVPRDGLVIVDVPAYRPTCRIYLFNLVKVGGGDDPLNEWNISVVRKGSIVRELSLRQVRELAMDQEGNHLLEVPK